MNRINTNKRAGKLAIFLFFTFLSLTTIAQNKDKKITIQNKNISLKEAFAQIETQTGYSIAYEQSNLNIEKKHSLSFKNVTIDKAMTQLLKETGYVYKIKGYHIIIFSQESKMKVLQINTVCGRGSTGRIATDLLSCLKESGDTGIIAYGIGPMLNAKQEEKYAGGND